MIINDDIMMTIKILTRMPTSSVARAMRVGGRIASRGNINRRENWDILGLDDDNGDDDGDDDDDVGDDDDGDEEEKD